jgi:uncharacterized protein
VRFQQFADSYVVRLESGEAIIASLTAFLSAEGVEFANVSAAGAVQWVQLGYWDPNSRAYRYESVDEQLEVVSFQGNAALKDGQPFLHIHGVFGRQDFTTLGGHVKEARARPTLEVWLRTEDVPVRRTRESATGLDLLSLPERVRGAPIHEAPEHPPSPS